MKVSDFSEILKKKGVDAAIILSLDSIGMSVPIDMLYFSSYSGIGALVLSQKKPFLLVPKMEYARAKKSRTRKVYVLGKKKLFESVIEKIKKNKIRRKVIGINKNEFTLNQFSALKKAFVGTKFKDISKELMGIREVKLKDEVATIKKACRITDEIMGKMISKFKGFRYETDVSAFLENEAKLRGCGVSFKPIVASGVSGSMPHYEPKKVKLRRGFCVIDFGVRYKGYCSDITRTICLGNAKKSEKDAYNRLLEIQEKAISFAKPGIKCSILYDFVKKSLGKDAKYFTHGLGHGVGVGLHELPNLKPGNEVRLKKDSVFTIEPGVYFPGKFGIRIEDDVYLGEKAVVLTKTPKQLIEVKR